MHVSQCHDLYLVMMRARMWLETTRKSSCSCESIQVFLCPMNIEMYVFVHVYASGSHDCVVCMSMSMCIGVFVCM